MTSAAAEPAWRAEPAGGVAAWAAGLAERVLGFGEASHARACALLLLLGLCCFLPGFVSLQPMDRDEPRFAQASKQMLETGDLVDIRFQAEARHKKPIGIYWAQAAAVAAGEAVGIPRARTTIALYRIPSLIGALAASLLAYWAALAFLPRRGALIAAAVFTACAMLSAEARLAKTDAVLAACSVAAMGALARAYLGRARLERGRAPATLATALIFWLAVAIGILIKGPMVPFFAGLTIAVLAVRDRSIRWLGDLRPVAGVALTALIVAPWFIAIAWKSAGAFFEASVGRDMLAKVGSGAEKHWAPPGSYAVAFFGIFWPGAAFAALAIPFAWKARGDDAVAFLLAWIVPAWLIFEAVSTKLPHYTLPLMPAVAILTVLAVGRGALSPERRGALWVAGLVVLIPIGVALGLSVAAWQLDRTIPWAGLPLLLIACAVAALAWAAYARACVEQALVIAVAASALLSAAVFGLTQPALASLKVSPRLGAIRDGLGCAAPKVASLGNREPSLVFTIGTDLAMLNAGRDAVTFLKAGGCRLVFIDSRFAQQFEGASKKLDWQATPIGRVTGFNINGGRHVDITAFASGLDDATGQPDGPR